MGCLLFLRAEFSAVRWRRRTDVGATLRKHDGKGNKREGIYANAKAFMQTRKAFMRTRTAFTAFSMS
jgi:hypothetical protein